MTGGKHQAVVISEDHGIDFGPVEEWAGSEGLDVAYVPCGDVGVDVVFCAVGSDGESSLAECRRQFPLVPLIAVGRDGLVSTVVASIRGGADDFLSAPIDPRELRATLARCAERRPKPIPVSGEAGKAIELLRASENIVMKRTVRLIEQVASTDITVLIRGESGTGKEIVARAVHELSPRATAPFVRVNCAALPSELLESELFGFERGAFTGAQKRKLGKFEHAEGGTIFLDEIGEMMPPLQAKLLQVLQDGEFSRLGGQHDVRVDTRILTATNRDLEGLVARGDFREDLFYRINVVDVVVPPLRDRIEDIEPLSQQFADTFSREYGREDWTLSPQDLECLRQHTWPGNVRELENTIRRMVVLGGELDLASEFGSRDAAAVPRKVDAKEVSIDLKAVAKRAARRAELSVMERVLRETRWNRKEAARRLSISYKALLYKMKDAGLRDA